MQNCMEISRLLKEGLVKTGLFDIISKDVGVHLVAFSLKDSSKFTVFHIAEALRKFGWIVPAYTMPADAEHVAVLRVVVREDFSRSLQQRLVSDFEKVTQELDELPPRASVKSAHVTVDKANEPQMKKNIVETQSQRDICSRWKRIADKKTSSVC